MNQAFKNLIHDNAGDARLSIIVAVFIFFIFGGGVIIFGLQTSYYVFCLVGVMLMLGGLLMIKKRKSDLWGVEYWLQQIGENSANVVWVVPVTVKHKVGFVFTIYKEQRFQLWTQDGMCLNFNCDTEDTQRIFFDGIRTHLPHAHIGYSEDIHQLYKTNKDFIAAMKERNLYRPVSSIVLTEG